MRSGSWSRAEERAEGRQRFEAGPKHLTFCADQRRMQQDPTGDFERVEELACSGFRRLCADVSPDFRQVGFGLIGETQAQQ